jgi:hypothetical protein
MFHVTNTYFEYWKSISYRFPHCTLQNVPNLKCILNKQQKIINYQGPLRPYISIDILFIYSKIKSHESLLCTCLYLK